MKSFPLPPCRLFIIFARRAKRAVFVRRGTSDWTELISYQIKELVDFNPHRPEERVVPPWATKWRRMNPFALISRPTKPQLFKYGSERGIKAHSFLPTWQAFTLERAQIVFREHILPHCQLWVGSDQDTVVAYLALKDAFVDRMYVDPAHQGQGWGTSLLEKAKALYPAGLGLYTHQENRTALSFYEKHGFTAVKFGISPPPESAPDVLYR